MNIKNPEKEYRPIPFWSWNERLEANETKRQIKLMDKAGIGGYFMHARSGLRTEYMGAEWFDNISVGIDMAEKLGMGAWAYDENGWPSGFGDGKINSLGIEYQQKRLHMENGEKHTETTIANVDGYHFYYEANPFYVDLLDCDVVKKFIDEIYEPYYTKYGNDMKGFFTDEPQLLRVGFPWSFKLKEMYETEYGEDLVPLLPQLFEDTGDYVNTRLKYWRLITKMFSENFAKQIYNWCDERGLKLTGHLLCEEAMNIQLPPNGAVMPSYEYFHVPGIDVLRRILIPALAPLQVSSVACQTGKKQVLSETYAMCGWNVFFEDLKWMFEWQMVRGVNLLCQHLQGYSLRGLRKRDYPASLYYHQPWWDEYRKFIDSISRIGMLLTEGRIEYDTLLIHPQSTAWVLYKSEGTNDKILEYNEKLNEIISQLESKHILFHLGDEIIMEKHACVEGNKLIIGTQEYSTVIIPPHLVLFESTKVLLEKFKRNGGIITTAEEIADKNIAANPNITYTKRIFDDFDMHYFVNSTDCEQPVRIKCGTSALNILTGEEEEFEKNTIIPPRGSMVVFDRQTRKENKAEAKAEFQKLGTEGTWTIKNCDFNAITLDKCKYSFDGDVINENGEIISIQARACALMRKVKIEMLFKLNVEYIPDDLYLVCETPEVFDIEVNGKPLNKDICGTYFDSAFKMLNLNGYLQHGTNEILFKCDFEQSSKTYEDIKNSAIFETVKNKLTFDMEIENIYIVGNFSVKTNGKFEDAKNEASWYDGDFIISNPVNSVKITGIEKQGFPFFSGKMTLKKTFSAEKGKNYVFSFSKKNANVVKVKLNGNELDDILWHPYCADLTEYIINGENHLEITLVGTLRNLLGPHHHIDSELHAVGPFAFFKEESPWNTRKEDNWDDRYCFVNFGIE